MELMPVKASAPVYRQTLENGTVGVGVGQASWKLPSLERNRSTSEALGMSGEYGAAGPSAEASGMC